MPEGEAPPKEDSVPTSSSRRDEPDRTVAPAVAIPDFPDLYPRQVTIHTWRVMHLRNPNTGTGNKVYEVNLNAMECSCPDWNYRKGESPAVCKHMAAALYAAPGTMDVGDALSFDTLELGREVRDLAENLQRRVTGLEADQAAASAPQGGSSPSPDVDPSDAAQRLQDAYDAVVEDMQVRATESYVWVQTGQDTPDSLPGPGNVDTWEAFIKNPEQIDYVDDEDPGDWVTQAHLDEKPGEWWKNAIEPGEVDDYISEVLE